MTSLIAERHDPAPGALAPFAATVTRCFAESCGRTPRMVAPEAIGATTSAAPIS
jgi:hypothetical protein